MIWLRIIWAMTVREYYRQALTALEQRGLHHSNEWAYVFWKKRNADDQVNYLERKNNERLARR